MGRNEQIRAIENELQKLGIIEGSCTNLEALCACIDSRVNTLSKLRNELVALSKESYYYDTVQYLSGIPIKNITFKDSLAILEELAAAEEKFKQDASKDFIDLAQRIRTKILDLDMKEIEASFKKDEVHFRLGSFYALASESLKERISKKYAMLRKRISKIQADCGSIDVRKQFKLLILREIDNYDAVFGTKLKMMYKSKTAGMQELPHAKMLQKLVFDLLSYSFSTMSVGEAEAFFASVLGSPEEQDDFLKDILLDSMRSYYKRDFPGKSSVRGREPIEI